jgi:integrase
MRKEITEREVKNLAVGAHLTDTLIKGFLARRLPSGVISFSYQYTEASGRRRWITIGLYGALTVKEARDEAKKYAGQVAARRDPAAEQKAVAARSENTVDHVLDQFLELYVKPEGLRSAVAIEQNFKNHVRPLIGAKCIYDLRRADIAKVIDMIGKDHPRMAHIAHALMRSAFNWWQLRDEDFKTPIVRGMVRDKTKLRTRILDAEEICDIWRALDEIEHVPECFAAYVKVLFLTACRRCEVSDMHRDELFGDKWVIPAARYKTKVDHVVPLIPAIKNLLPKRRHGFVFSSDGGATALDGFAKTKNELDAAIGLIRRREHRKAMPAWTYHDARRTGRTMLAELGVNRETAEAVLGHTIGGVEARYNQHKYLVEKAAALTKLADHVERITRTAVPAKLRVVA